MKKVVREGRCLECGVKVAVYGDGSRDECDCRQKRPDTAQDKHFSSWFEKQTKTTKRPRF